MTAALMALVAGAMMLVRFGWADTAGVRHRIAAATGWGVALVVLMWLAARDGAWGIAMGVVTGIVAALALVLLAGWRSPARTRRPASEAPSIVIPHRLPDIVRRVAVFALVVPCAFVAAQWLAFGVQALARRGGMGDSDSVALTLFFQPIAWAVIMAVQMTRADATRMIAPPVVAATLGTILWTAA